MARRRANGEGSIWQQTSGLWQGQLTLPSGADGKRRRVSVYGHSKREVRDKLDALIQQQASGVAFEAGAQTLSQYLAWWLDAVVRTSCKPNTHLSYSSTVRLYVDPHIGGVPLGKVTADHIQGLLSTLERLGYSKRVRHLTYTVLHVALHRAVKAKRIPWNPADAVVPPKPAKSARPVWDKEQVKTFLDASKQDWLYPLYLTVLHCAAREGELLALQWKDIDFKTGETQIKWNLVEQKGRFLCTPEYPDGRHPVKSRASNRTISLPKTVLEALRQHRSKIMAEGLAASPWVFPTLKGGYSNKEGRMMPPGGPYLKSNMIKQFKAAMAKAGVPPIRFHDLRHTAATLMATDGTDAKTVSAQLGHASVSFTMDTYVKATPASLKAAAQRLEELLK